MAAPWEQYAQSQGAPQAAQGPWSNYAAPEGGPKPFLQMPRGYGPSPQTPISSPLIDSVVNDSPVGRVLSAFGQGAKEGYGAAIFDPDTMESLRKYGAYENFDAKNRSIAKAFQDAIARGAASTLYEGLKGAEEVMKVGSAAFSGTQAATEQAFTEAGQPQLGRDIAAMPEAFFGHGPGSFGAAGAFADTAKLASIRRAQSLKVIGDGEEGFMGVKETTPEEHAEAIKRWIDAYDKYNEPLTEQTEARPATASEAAEAPQPAEHGPSIAEDVSKKLVAAGRPQDEADAAAAIIQARYQARADRFRGMRGTADDLYQQEGPEITSQITPVGEKEFAQSGRGKISFTDAKATITLFEDADPSTFIHETGHQWLEELTRDAADDRAPADLVQDAQTVRNWLGAQEGKAFTRAQHEKFARGFERYMMEGKAPSPALEGVFAKFKEWLTTLYKTVQRLRSPINDEIRGVFDRMIGAGGETVDKPVSEAPRVESAIEGQKLQAEAAPVEQAPAIAAPAINSGEVVKKAAQPVNPNIPFRNPNPDLIDKAGNIVIKNLNQPEDINEVLRQTARENAGFNDARRGVVTDAQVAEFADSLGLDGSELNIQKLRDMSVNDGIPFAARILRGRQMLIESAANVRDAWAKARSGSPEALLEMAQAEAKHLMVQETLSAITAEWGRAGRAFRELDYGGIKEAQAIAEFLQSALGKTPEEMRARAIMGADLKTTAQISKFNKDAWTPTLKDKLIWIRQNALISGPITHMYYGLANELTAMFRGAVTVPAKAILGKATAKEAQYSLMGFFKGHMDGVYAALQAWRENIQVPLPGEIEAMEAEGKAPRTKYPSPIGGKLGAFLGAPGRAISAIHSFSVLVAYQQRIYELAVRDGVDKGLSGDALTGHIAQFVKSPSAEAMDIARDSAYRQVYMNKAEYGSTIQKWQSAIDSLPLGLGKLAVPFMQIGAHIVEATAEHSVAGMLSKGIRDDLFGRNGELAAEEARAKMMAGTALTGATIGLAAGGLMTGDGPQDPEERRVWLMDHAPNSLKIGNWWVPLDRLGHLGKLMSASATLYESAHRMEEGEIGKGLGDLIGGMSHIVVDELWMAGLSEALNATMNAHKDPKGAMRYVEEMATSFVPYSTALQQTAKLVDQQKREHRGLAELEESKLPFVSRGLYPAIDVFGQPIPSKPSNVAYVNDPVVREMWRLGVFPSKLEPLIRNVELTEKQYYEYATLAGVHAKEALDEYVNSPEWGALPDYLKRRTMTEIIKNAREQARGAVMMENYDDIVGRASEEKDRQIHGTGRETRAQRVPEATSP